MNLDAISKYSFLFFLATALFAVFYFSRPLPPSGKTVVRFLTYETGPEQMNLVNTIKRNFEAENPDIEVQVEFNNQARDKIYVEMASGTAPDTFYCVTDDIPRLAVKQAIEPLTEHFAKDKTADLNVFFPEVVDALRYAPPAQKIPKHLAELYSYPIHFSTDILFYNEDLFRQEGVPLPRDNWTWEEFIDAATRLIGKKWKGQRAFGMFLPDTVTTIMSNNGRIFNEDYTRCLINNPQAIEAVREMHRLRWVDKVAPSPAQVQETSSMQMFKLGQLAMMPGRTYMVVDFNKIKDFKYNACLMPGMKKPVERLAVGGVCMSRQSKHKDAAWRWMKFYCSPEGGGKVLGDLKNCVTAIKEYAYSPDYFLKPPPENTRILVDSLYAAEISVPPIVNASEYANRIQKPIFDDMLRLKNADIPKMLKTYEDETNKLLLSEPK